MNGYFDINKVVDFLLEEMNINQVEKKAFIYYSLLFCIMKLLRFFIDNYRKKCYNKWHKNLETSVKPLHILR